MAHFAQINENNEVTQVIVVSNEDCLNQYGQESEEIGALFCHRLLGGTWLQTSYNATLRKNFAGVGYIYDPARDAFIPPQPSPEWALDEETCKWVSPDDYVGE